ncbi:MAG: HAMP domain-containing sensor histidine kinase [Planctomycetaceae bacterium]
MRQFTADAAHEFRTPLTVIRSSAELALHCPREETYYRECLLGIAEETNRLTSLSNQLLTLAREDAGLSGAPSEIISLGSVLEQVVADLEPLAEDRALTIKPPGPVLDLQVWGEPSGLRRVFLNLIDNAIKFTPTGGHVAISIAATSHHAVVTVTDDGPGISETHLPRLFERFYRVDPSRSRASGGAGLGLAISRAIVLRHGGTIRVSNCPEGGTEAEVRLPIAGRA